MTPTEPEPEPRPRGHDWQARLALVWAVGFGLLYARMVIQTRLPGLAAWLP